MKKYHFEKPKEVEGKAAEILWRRLGKQNDQAKRVYKPYFDNRIKRT